MKIVVIRNSWHIGGAELYWIKLASAFKDCKIQCQFILISNNKDLLKLAHACNISTYFINTFGEEVGTKKGLLRLFFNLPDYLIKYSLTISKIWWLERPSLFILSGKTEKYVLTLMLRLFRQNVFWIEHGQVFTKTMAKEALFLYKRMSYWTNAILAESHDTEENLTNNGINSSKIYYLGSGVDTHIFTYGNNKNRQKFTIGYVGSITWEKGIEDFLNTARSVCKINDQIDFVLVGIGPQIKWVENYLKKYDLGKKVELAQYKYNPKPYYSRMSIFLFPINFNGAISLSLLEAMSMGIVPIVTDIGGNDEVVVNHKNGYVLSSPVVKKATKIIINLYKNRRLLVRLSANARRRIVNHYSVHQLVNRWIILINSIK